MGKLSSVLCDDLESWDGAWLKKEEVYVYFQLIHIVV